MWLIVLIMSPFIIWLDAKLFKIFYKLIFRDEQEFNNSVKYKFTPDIFSLFRGEYLKDNFAEFKLGIFIMLCIGTIILEVNIVSTML